MLAMGAGSVCMAGGALPASLQSEPQQRDPYNWQARHAAVKQYVAAHKPEYVVIGDSITHHWGGEPSLGSARRAPEAWEALFAGHTVANMGFGFDYIDNAYYRIQDGELAGHSPRVIIVWLGTNNLGHRHDSPQQCAANMKAFLDLLRKEAPGSKILLLSILPRLEKELAAPIAETNRRYQQLADNATVHFLDLTTIFSQQPHARKDSVTGNPQYLLDKVHPNKKGYQAIAPLIRQALQRIDSSY